MKIGEIIQRVQSLYQKGVESDDSRLSNKHIYNKLISSRAYLISQIFKKRFNVSEMNYQRLKCIELITVDAHECNCLPSTFKKILRSKYKIPKIVDNGSGLAIRLVADNNNKVISKTDSSSLSRITYNKFTGIQPYYAIYNDYLYIINIKLLKVVNIEAIFEDPISVYRFTTYCSDKNDVDRDYLCTPTEECDNCLCQLNTQYEFPVDTSLIDLMIQSSVAELIKLFYSVKEDKNNDTSDVSNSQQYISSNNNNSNNNG